MTISFKKNKANITNIISTNTTKYDSYETALLSYAEAFAVAASEYQPIGNFDAIMDKYYELNPSDKSMSDLRNDFLNDDEDCDDEDYDDEDYDEDTAAYEGEDLLW